MSDPIIYVDSTLRAEWVLPIFFRAEIGGFVLLNRKSSRQVVASENSALGASDNGSS